MAVNYEGKSFMEQVPGEGGVGSTADRDASETCFNFTKKQIMFRNSYLQPGAKKWANLVSLLFIFVFSIMHHNLYNK